MLVIDPEREYAHLAEAVGGTYVNISLNSDSRINPFDLPKSPPSGSTPADIIRSAVITVKGLLKIMLGEMTTVEDSILDQGILQTYAKKDITPDVDLAKMEPPLMNDLVDVLDSIALALMQTAETQDPATAFEAAAGNVQFSVEEFANDLPGALTALNGSDCNSAGGGDTGGGGDNPLAGTPLEPLGAALAPVLSQFPGAGGEPGDSPDMDLRSVSVLVSQLALAFDAGLAQIPAEARTAPVFGGILTTLSTGLADLSVTLTHFGAYNGDSTAAALETTLNNLLVNVLTNVVPVNFAEAQAGQEGTLSGPIISGVNQITSALGDNLLAAAVPQLTAALDGELSVLLDPIENTLLPALLGPVSTALAGGGSAGGAGSLGVILGPLTEALTGGGSASNPTGTPLGRFTCPRSRSSRVWLP